MELEALSAVVAATLEADGRCFWDVDVVDSGQVNRVRLSLNPDFSDHVTLREWGTGVFMLDIRDTYSLPEFDYDEDTEHEAVEVQLRRALDYLHGRCTEATKTRGRTVISRTLTFPNGTTATVRTPPLQRPRARITGKSRQVTSATIT